MARYSISLVGDATGAVRAVKSTSTEVEKLNKDLDESSKLFTDVRGKVNSLGQIALTSVAGIGAAAAVFTESTISQVAELERLSSVSNVATGEFQKYAAGAKLVGVEQDKLADIFKDTNDKIGDFLQTGGGPLADFFENIAPQIGVTAEQFRKLSGPQALELYVSSLERAGVSQNEMTFFMEALASDATLLLPLLQNNAAGFKTLGDAAEDAGAIMDGRIIASSQQLNATLFLLDQGVEGFKNQLRSEMIPVISDLAVGFYNLSSDATVAEFTAGLLNGTIKNITTTGIGAVAVFDLLGKTLGGFLASVDGLFDGVTLEDALFSPRIIAKIRANAGDAKEILTVSVDDLNQTALKYGEAINNINNAGEGSAETGGINEKVQAIVDLQNQIREGLGQSGGSASFTPVDEEAVKEIDKARTALENLQGSLETQVATFGLGETAVLKYRLANGDLADEVKRLGVDGEELALSIIAQSEVYEQLKEQQEIAKVAEQELQKQKQAGLQLTESMQTAEEIHNRELAEYNRLLQEGHITQETFNRAVADSEKSFEKAKKGMNEMSVYAEQAARNMQDSFADFLFDPFDGGIKGMAKGFIDSIRRMAAEAAASKIFDLLKTSVGNTGIGGSIAGFFGFEDGGIMSANGSLPLKTYSNGGIANSPQLALFGEGRMNEAYVPLPDGRSIPVTMSMESAAGQSQPITIINNGAPVRVVSDSMNGNERQIVIAEAVDQSKRAVATDIIRGDGDIANAMESVFGLNRAIGSRR